MPQLTLLPNLVFPITPSQVSGLMDNIQRLNWLDAGLDPLKQKALDILFHLWELYADTAGAVDYTGKEGHARLYQDSMTFIPEQTVRKHGDLRAGHLAINFNNMQAKLKKAGFALQTADVNELVYQSRDLLTLPMGTDEKMSLLLNYLAKKQV